MTFGVIFEVSEAYEDVERSESGRDFIEPSGMLTITVSHNESHLFREISNDTQLRRFSTDSSRLLASIIVGLWKLRIYPAIQNSVARCRLMDPLLSPRERFTNVLVLQSN